MNPRSFELIALSVFILSFTSGCAKNYILDPSYKKERHIEICLEENQPGSFQFKNDAAKEFLVKHLKINRPEKVNDSLSKILNRNLPKPFILYKSKFSSAISIPPLSDNGVEVKILLKNGKVINTQIWGKSDIEKMGNTCRYVAKAINPRLSLRASNPQYGPSTIIIIESEYLIYDYKNEKVVAAGEVYASSLDIPDLIGGLFEISARSIGEKIIQKSPFYGSYFNQDVHPQPSSF